MRNGAGGVSCQCQGLKAACPMGRPLVGWEFASGQAQAVVKPLPVGHQHPGRQSRQTRLQVGGTRVREIQPELLALGGQGVAADQIVAAGGHLWACRMSADMNKFTMDDLRDDVEGIISASDFIEMTDGAQLLFI